MSSILQKLEQNRTPILLAEIGAWLHLLGRFSKEFIYSNAEDADANDKNFDYQKICNNNNFFEESGLDSILNDPIWNCINNFKAFGNLGELSENPVNSICDFIKKHTWKNSPKGLCKLLADAHGIVSGIDKALAGRGWSGKQKKAYTFKSSAFGYEEKLELLQKQNLKKEFLYKLKDIMTAIKNNKDNLTYDNYEEFIALMRKYYPKTLGETRRPINEISLFDYTHIIASLMKSNLAKMIVDGWYDPKGKSQWKILKINIDVIRLMAKGLKIGDILGYRKELKTTYDEIKRIVEYEYPLGNELYRDSTGVYFSCPNFEQKEEFEKEIKEKLQNLNRLDCDSQVNLSSKSRSLVILAQEREDSLNTIVFPHAGYTGYLESDFKDSLNNGGEDVCPVCRIRLKNEKSDRCKKCKERYEKRSKNWLDEIQSDKKTIWLDEVADHNDRVALIVGHFDLRRWLSGEFLDTFVSQTFDKWKQENSDICNKLSINKIEDLKRQFEIMFSDFNLSNDQKELCRSFIEIRLANFNTHFWQPIAERDATGEALTLSNNSTKAKHLIKLLFRKHPSPARIRRCWETTQDFIKNTVIDDIIKNYSYAGDSPYIELRNKRIQFVISPSPKVLKGATIDVDIDGVRLSPVCIDKDIFITTTNLQILSSKGKTVDELAHWMNGKEIKIKNERDNKWNSGYRITNARHDESKFQDYLPYVPIYDFPDQFMVLVPAYDALEIAKKIVNAYEIHFSKVRDRLPFHLGVIAFHRRTPLYVAMDAGKRIIDVFRTKTKTINARVWSIADVQHSKLGHFVKELTLIPDPCYSTSHLIWQISYSTGDPAQQDEWHPYIRVNGNPVRGNYSFDYDGNGHYVVHVKELKPTDCIKIETSYLKITFLEKASDRFRIDENLRPLDDIKRLEEIWNDLQGIVNSKGIGIAQIYAFWQEVKKRRGEYSSDLVWENFVRSSLTNIFKLSPVKDSELFNKLFQATKDGLLDICLYWNLQVRKTKFEKQEANHE